MFRTKKSEGLKCVIPQPSALDSVDSPNKFVGTSKTTLIYIETLLYMYFDCEHDEIQTVGPEQLHVIIRDLFYQCYLR